MSAPPPIPPAPMPHVSGLLPGTHNNHVTNTTPDIEDPRIVRSRLAAVGKHSQVGKHNTFHNTNTLLRRINDSFCDMLDHFDSDTCHFEHQNLDFHNNLHREEIQNELHEHQYQHYLHECHDHSVKMEQYLHQKLHHDEQLAHSLHEFRKWYVKSDPRHLRQKGYRLTHLGTVPATDIPVLGRRAPIGQFTYELGVVPAGQTRHFTQTHGVPIHSHGLHGSHHHHIPLHSHCLPPSHVHCPTIPNSTLASFPGSLV